MLSSCVVVTWCRREARKSNSLIVIYSIVTVNHWRTPASLTLGPIVEPYCCVFFFKYIWTLKFHSLEALNTLKQSYRTGKVRLGTFTPLGSLLCSDDSWNFVVTQTEAPNRLSAVIDPLHHTIILIFVLFIHHISEWPLLGTTRWRVRHLLHRPWCCLQRWSDSSWGRKSLRLQLRPNESRLG